MSEKKRQKKDGADKNKKNQRLHEASSSGGTVKENAPNKRQGAAESDIKKD